MELHHAHIVTDLFQGGMQPLIARAQLRLENGDYLLVLSNLFGPFIIFISFTGLLCILKKWRDDIITLVVCAGYLLALFAIYLTTFHELIEHLEHSAVRVTMPVVLMLYVSSLKILQEREKLI